MNIVLIGMRCSGKSTISRRLSVATKRPVLSTDLLISYESGGRSIPAILADHNGDWRPFRRMERAVVEKVAALDGIIIDCGGGVVVELDERGDEIYARDKMDLLKRNGLVVWLHGDIPRLVAKAQKKSGRPSLGERISTEEMMHRRLPFYRQAADMVVDIEGENRKEDNLVREILQRLPAPATP
ncbi:MAG: shikimate kinase [Magnetococcales bacterium]|nr:shikimate kinase [Magnetococcales bacterium]